MNGTNIDNLNFKVILDDEHFDEQVKRDIALAKDLNVQLSALLNVKSKVATSKMVGDATKAARYEKATANAAIAQERLKTATTNTAAAQERLATAAANAANAQERLKQSQMRTEQLTRRITAQTEKQNKAYTQQSRILNELKGLALGYLSIHGAGQLLSSLVRVTGEFELQKTTLAAMLGDLNSAEQIITRIQGLAVESPFQFKELTTYAKQLSAFSVPAQELYDTTKMLADVSAGLGVGMDRIVLAYGQVRSAAFLRGQEVRQFTEAGIPILDELAKQFSELRGTAVSTAEVFDLISKRMVPFEMVAKVFKDMTSEGGKFFNMQEVQAETLRGKISNLKDAYEVMLNEIGKGQSENLKEAVDWARRLMQNYEQTGRTLVELIATYGIYKSTLLAIEVVTNSFTLANHKLIASLVNAGKFLLTNPYVAFTAALTGVAYALYKQHTALEGYQKLQKEVASTQSNYNKEVSKEIAKLDALYAKLKLAKKGTDEYNEARKEIFTQYSGYISELRNEGIEVNNLAGIYDILKTKIEDATKARTSSKAKQRLSETYDQELDSYYDKYIEIITKAQKQLNRQAKLSGNEYKEFSEFEKAGFWKYLTGSMNKGDLEETVGLERVVNLLNNANLDAAANLKKLRTNIIAATNEYNKSLKEIKRAYGETENTVIQGGGIPMPGGDEEDPAKYVKEQIDAVRRLRDAYDTLAPYMNGDMLRKTLTALFPNADQRLIQSLDFRGRLVELAAELNKFDETASQKLLDSLSGERASEIASAFKAVETYKNMLDQWLGEDFNLTGEGVAFDISKILRDLNNQYAKINQKSIQASDLLTKAQMGDEAALKTVREVYGEEVWQKYLINGQRTIDELARLEREAARKTADEKIKALADDYVKELLGERNIDLTNFDDKTISQVEEILKRLANARSEAQEELNKIYEGGVTEEEISKMDMLMEALKLIKQIIDDTDVEKEKKIFDNIRDGLENISDLGGKIESLGEAIGNKLISGLGREMSDLAKYASDFLEAFDAKDTISMIASVASYAITKVVDVINAVYEHQKALNDASKEYRDLLIDIRRESYSGMFGTDEIALAAENTKILAEAQKNYEESVKKIQNKKFQLFGGSFWRNDSVENVVADFLESAGESLYDAEGGLNLSALETYFDAYASRLTKKQRDMVQNLIDNGKALDDAALQQAEYLTNLFSGVADNIASSMVEAFIESGDAAMDMGNIISDLSKQMVADLIKSVYLMPILKDYKEQFAAIDADASLSKTEKTERQLNLLDSALAEISGQSDSITATIERFEEYLRAGDTTSGTSALGEGIKGITEDQANLLASYLNAIRADVSFSKTLWIRMDANLQRLADMLVSSPTLMEYQAQIAANTYNTAQATQEMLAYIRSVVTYDGDGASIRIYS